MPDGWNMLKLKPAEIMDFPLPTYILKNGSYTESWQFHELGTPLGYNCIISTWRISLLLIRLSQKQNMMLWVW